MKMKDLALKIQEIVVNNNVQEPFFIQNFNKERSVRQMMNVGHKQQLEGWLQRLESEYPTIEMDDFIFIKGNTIEKFSIQKGVIK